MRSKVLYSLVIDLVISLSVKAQDVIPKFKQDNMLWFGYYNSVVLNPKWSINSDAQLRTKNWHKDLSQALIRPGLSYKANEKVTLTVGVAYFRLFITDALTRGEWRPWQELMLKDKIREVKLSHRFRLEQRFNQKTDNDEPIDEYQFNYRFRYRLDVRAPLKKESEANNLYVWFGNEVMINAGASTTKNYFDQNRSYVGINYELNRRFSFQLQYMHIWQLLSNGITMNNIDVIRFNIYQTIEL